jgi:hypothetical protein
MKNLNCSHFFLTCNAINMQWNDLYKHMSNFEIFQNSNDTEREQLTHRLLQKNFHITAEYLNRRFQVFFKLVLKQKFSIRDYWHRYEWQTRDNKHVHDFLWLENASIFERLEEFLVYWESQTTTINSVNEISSTLIYSCSKSFRMRQNNLQKLTKLLNWMQKHTKCTSTYYLRKTKNSKKIQCKFHFSFFMKKTITIFNINNSKWKFFESIRNNSLFNTYNVIVSINWLANIDVNLCIDQHALLSYIAKYCSKTKKKSFKLIDVMRSVVSIVSSKSFMLLLMIKMMNKLIIERDWSAQKICHHFFKRDLKRLFKIIHLINLYSSKITWSQNWVSNMSSNSTRFNPRVEQEFLFNSRVWTKIFVQTREICMWRARFLRVRAVQPEGWANEFAQPVSRVWTFVRNPTLRPG